MKIKIDPKLLIEIHPGVRYWEEASILLVDVKKVEIDHIPLWERPNDFALAMAVVQYVRNGHPKIRIAGISITGLVDF